MRFPLSQRVRHGKKQFDLVGFRVLQMRWYALCIAGSLDVMEIFNGREVFKMKVQVGDGQ